MNDDKLVLYYYDELDDAERAGVLARLSADDILRARYERLRDELDGLRPDDPPAPPALADRLHDVVETAANRERRQRTRRRVDFGSFFWGAAVTAALVVGIFIGGQLDETSEQASELPTLVTATVPESNSLERGMLVHFRDTRQQLFDAGDSANRILIAGRIIEQNRMMQRLAEDSNADDLARILRAMEPVLVRLATEELSPGEARAVQQQLIFEMNVVLTKLAQEPSEESGSI